MPTTRPRHTITETDEIVRAIDDAARRWPEDRDARRRLVVRLIREGHRAIGQHAVEEAERRGERIRRSAGALTGLYPPDYLDTLRADWPE